MDGIKKIKLTDSSRAEFGQGGFDDWCVYYTPVAGKKERPRDQKCFSWLLDLAEEHGTDRVYKDFVKIYDKTGKKVEKAVLGEIVRISKGYGEDSQLAETAFVILYMTMIAEENKEHSKLGRRIKRLGIYEVLKNGQSIEYAATFMKDMKWQEIDKLCKERGF